MNFDTNNLVWINIELLSVLDHRSTAASHFLSDTHSALCLKPTVFREMSEAFVYASFALVQCTTRQQFLGWFIYMLLSSTHWEIAVTLFHGWSTPENRGHYWLLRIWLPVLFYFSCFRGFIFNKNNNFQDYTVAIIWLMSSSYQNFNKHFLYYNILEIIKFKI